MRRDPRTGEPILYEFRRRSRGRATVDWRTDWWRVPGPVNPFWSFGPGTPVRGILVGMLLAVPILFSGFDWTSPFELTLACAGLGVAFTAPVFVELGHRRDFLTSTRLVHQYGLLGRARKEIRVSAIEQVELDQQRYWPAAEVWDVGDVIVHSPGDVLAVGRVYEPGAAMQAILSVRDGRAAELTDDGASGGTAEAALARRNAVIALAIAVLVGLYSWWDYTRLAAGRGRSPLVAWAAFLFLIGWYGLSLYKKRRGE